MSRPTPSMEMFMVGAYLQFVESCGSVTYNTEPANPKEYWVEVVGRDEAGQSITYVDFPEKFDWYPTSMRPDTLVKKLVKRYVELREEGQALEYEPDHIRCQLWMPRPPARRVAEALPKVQQRLLDEHQIRLELVDPPEMARRVPAVVERGAKLTFDYDNLFIRALLIAQGRLDYQVGAPMAQERIEAMYRFPVSLRSAADVPGFVYRFLSSREIVHWLDFYSPSLDDMAVWAAEAGPGAGLGELQRALAERGEVTESPEDYDYEEDEDEGRPPYRTRRYSAHDLAELTRLVLANADALQALAAQDSLYGGLHLEIDFMLPFLSRVQDRIDPGLIEREILRYGGDRDQMLAHFANQYPEKRPYRAILRLEFIQTGRERPAPYPGGKTMDVHIDYPGVTSDTEVAATISYAEDFTGYFVLMMSRLAASLML